jgi:hypothetical protein
LTDKQKPPAGIILLDIDNKEPETTIQIFLKTHGINEILEIYDPIRRLFQEFQKISHLIQNQGRRLFSGMNQDIADKKPDDRDAADICLYHPGQKT